MPELLTITDFCTQASIPESTVRYWRSLGEASPITFVKVGKLVRVPAAEIARLIRRNSMGGRVQYQ